MENNPAENSTLPAEEPKKKTEQEIVSRIESLKKSYEQATVDSREMFKEIFSVYMGKTGEIQSTPYNTTDDIPKLRTEVSYVKPAIFSGEPVVEFEGIGDEDKAVAKIYEKIVNHRFTTIPGFREKVEMWVGQAVTFGTSEAKVVWRYAEQDNGDGTLSPVQDEPDIEVPNHMDVYFNPIIPEIKDQECLIFRSVLPVHEVKENPIYDYRNLDGIRNAELIEESGSQTDQYNSSILSNTDLPAAQTKATAGMVEVFELIDDDRIQTIANGKLLRDTENVYGMINAVKLIFEPNAIPNRYEGFGLGQNTLELGKMFYKMFNQLSTSVKMSNNPMFLFKKGSVKDKRQLVSKPGGGIEVTGDGPITNEISAIQFPDIKQGAIEILNRIDDEHKRASGATDLVQGSASNDTLGQDQIVQGNVSNRFELVVRRFKAALSEVANMMLKMELQNLQSPDAAILRIFPEKLRPSIYEILISSKDDVKYNVRIKGETNIARNKQLESKRLVELFNVASGIETEMGPLLTNKELRAILRKGLELQGEQNIDELVAEEKEQPMMPQMGMPQDQPMMPQAMPQMPDQQVMPQ